MTPRQREVIDAIREAGSQRKAAKKLGMNVRSLKSVLSRLRKDDPAWTDEAIKRGFDPAHGGWLKFPAVDGEPGASVFIRREGPPVQEIIAEAFAAFDGRAKPIPPPQFASDDLLNAVFIPDWHAGLHSWGRETGEDYSTKIAGEVLRDGLARIVPRLSPAKRGVVIAPGDVMHQNDARNMTPRSGHILDVDGRFLKVMETAAGGLIDAVALMTEHHSEVDVVILPGNHDPEAALMLAFALRMFYSREPRVNVHDGAGLWWHTVHGLNLLTATHGHTIKQANIGPYVAAEWPQAWGATRHRFAFSGHIHHERSREFPGILCEALRPITARDAHAAGAYQSQREITAMTFHADRGRINRAYEALC